MVEELAKFESKDLLEDIYKKIKGKVTLLFGPSLVGKTTLAIHLSKKFKHPVLLFIDRNLTSDEIKKINSKIAIFEIDSYEQLYDKLQRIERYAKKVFEEGEESNLFDFVIVDSLTGLNEELSLRYKPPKLYLELARNQKNILFLLSKLKKYGISSLVITHSRLADFETRRIEPSINNKVLKHVDIVYFLYIDKEGNRVLKLWAERKLPLQIELKLE